MNNDIIITTRKVIINSNNFSSYKLLNTMFKNINIYNVYMPKIKIRLYNLILQI